MTPAARLNAAIDILDGFETSGLPADRFIREFFRARRYAGSKDRASVSERVYAVLRHRAEFAWRMQADTTRALVMASALAEGDTPDAVAALFTGGGYGPAVLSDDEARALAQPPAGEPPLAARGEFPSFLQPELERRFGAALLDEMRAQLERAPVDLRVNTLKFERAEVLRELCEAGYEAEESAFAPHGIRIAAGKGSAALQQGDIFKSGGFEFQDEAAQIAAALCAVQPGMRVLDLAAGAGGKSLALAAAMNNTGEIIACDVRRGALDQLETRAKRAGATNIKARLASALGPNELFDVVLVDAPCSGTGTWRRQPELRWRLTSARLEGLMSIQDFLLKQAATHLNPGGRLVYATCSLLPCENEDRVETFKSRQDAFATIRADAVWQEHAVPGLTDVFRASPLLTATDGFFVAILERKNA